MMGYIRNIPFYNTLRKVYRVIFLGDIEKNPFNNLFYPGHYYSPIPSINDVKEYKESLKINELISDISGININRNEQIQLLGKIEEIVNGTELQKERCGNIRYYWNNGYYGYGDGIVLSAIIRIYKPRKIIEVGSGYSSALMLDVNEKYFDNGINMTFIEPFPDRLNGLVKGKNLVAKIIVDKVQNVDIKSFESLESGDILFVDSSHVGKLNNDLLHIIFKILPILKPGVIIHFHDIFWPFEYPIEWIEEGKAWNEIYYIRALLLYSKKFKIIFMSDYLAKCLGESYVHALNAKGRHLGYNLWLEVLGES